MTNKPQTEQRHKLETQKSSEKATQEGTHILHIAEALVSLMATRVPPGNSCKIYGISHRCNAGVMLGSLSMRKTREIQ